MKVAHIGLPVRDLQKSKAFYTAALAPLGLPFLREKEDSVHFGTDGRTLLWLHTRSKPSEAIHIAFEAGTRAQVDAFHAAALAAGGKDNGAPGVREHYHSNYYAAFVFDPDGNNVEVVCRNV